MLRVLKKITPLKASSHTEDEGEESYFSALTGSSSTFLFPRKERKTLYPIWIELMYKSLCEGGTNAKLMVCAGTLKRNDEKATVRIFKEKFMVGILSRKN